MGLVLAIAAGDSKNMGNASTAFAAIAVVVLFKFSRFSRVEESLFYASSSTMHFVLKGLRVRGWLVKGVGLIIGGGFVATVGVIMLGANPKGGAGGLFLGLCLALAGASILFRDGKLGTMMFLDHQRPRFDMLKSDFDELYSVTGKLKGKLMVTMAELKEAIDDETEPDNVFEQFSAAVHFLLALLKDPKAEHWVFALQAWAALCQQCPFLHRMSSRCSSLCSRCSRCSNCSRCRKTGSRDPKDLEAQVAEASERNKV